MVGILDYGMGNVRSVLNALDRVGAPGRLVSEPADVLDADRLVIPGVGAFGDAMLALDERGLSQAVRDTATSGRPILGLCLGMQLLASRSTEFGDHKGLDLIPGVVERLQTDPSLRIPHVGWNDLVLAGGGDPILAELGPDPTFYFVHSFEFRPEDPSVVTAFTDYGRPVTACVSSQRVFGVQFHPEKSAEDGLTLLRNFVTC